MYNVMQMLPHVQYIHNMGFLLQQKVLSNVLGIVLDYGIVTLRTPSIVHVSVYNQFLFLCGTTYSFII